MTRSSLALLVALCLAACGSGDRDAEGRPSEVLPEVAVEAAPERVTPSLYDEEGNLRPSDVRVAGLTLPMGLTPNVTEERVHTYLSDVPIARLLRYFGPRLTTGQVEERPGGGATYRAAVPREVTTGAVQMDVTIMPVPGPRALIEISEIPPEPTSPRSEAESIQALGAAMQSAE